MLITAENLENCGILIDTLDYRGFKINFYEDQLGRQLVSVWRNQLLEFGSDSTSYREDMMLIIDDYLDTITRFKEYPGLHGSKLAYFQNGGYRDIQLSYKGRLLKLYLLQSGTKEDDIKNDAFKVLNQYLSELALN